MIIHENISLKPYNTFGIDTTCSFFIEIHTAEDLHQFLGDEIVKKYPILILGGGSNILFTKPFKGIVLKNCIEEIKILNEKDDYIDINVGAGVNWHEFVLYCIENNYCGIENLSLIPGNVGASPMQNIGAYGVEVKDVITHVNCICIKTNTAKTFTNDECNFGYRTSIFKTKEKGKYIITSVTFRLYKTSKLNISYGAIKQELSKLNIKRPTIKDVSTAIINIRKSKLPDPNKIGNGGSFFKNPIVSENQLNHILNLNKEAPYYPQQNNTYKLAAGWLIEQAGWKGKTFNNHGVHKNQALVLVNYGGATGSQIYNLSEQIIASVKSKFGVILEREINVY